MLPELSPTYLLAGFHCVNSSFIMSTNSLIHITILAYMAGYITILLINYMLGGSISYYILHFITFVIVSLIMKFMVKVPG
jgi:hypothetical protein